MLDTGCGQLIVDGKIKVIFQHLLVPLYKSLILLQVKQGVDVEKLEADGMVFKDGSKIIADVIVLAYVSPISFFGAGLE